MISALLGYFFAGGEIFHHFQYEPKRLLAADFLDGFFRTLPFAAVIAGVAVLLQLFLRKKMLLLLAGVMVIGIGLIAAILFYIPVTALTILLFALLLLSYLLLVLAGGYLYSWCSDA
ncbi:MAG: hypothetical protein KDJ38_06460 [Gammaproteobacteria bacterium]|nr:hypothetical protein [Gammaproteobacteria bacterium]